MLFPCVHSHIKTCWACFRKREQLLCLSLGAFLSKWPVPVDLALFKIRQPPMGQFCVVREPHPQPLKPPLRLVVPLCVRTLLCRSCHQRGSTGSRLWTASVFPCAHSSTCGCMDLQPRRHCIAMLAVCFCESIILHSGKDCVWLF